MNTICELFDGFVDNLLVALSEDTRVKHDSLKISPKSCFPELYHVSREEMMDEREKELLGFWQYCSGVVNCARSDLAVTWYAYDEQTTKSILDTVKEHLMLAEIVKNALLTLIRKRINDWNIKISLDDDGRILIGV